MSSDTNAALVTRGSVGIGKAIAQRLAADGYPVVVCARGEERLNAVAADIDGDTLVVPTDVTLFSVDATKSFDEMADS